MFNFSLMNSKGQMLIHTRPCVRSCVLHVTYLYINAMTGEATLVNVILLLSPTPPPPPQPSKP